MLHLTEVEEPEVCLDRGTASEVELVAVLVKQIRKSKKTRKDNGKRQQYQGVWHDTYNVASGGFHSGAVMEVYHWTLTIQSEYDF